MPRAADDGDALEALLARCPQALAHVGLALRLAGFGRGFVAAHLGHRLGHGGEDAGVVAAFLDPAVPPALAVRVAVGTGEVVERIASRAARCGFLGGFNRRLGFRLVQRQRVRARQVDEPRRDPAPDRPLQRLPLRGKPRKRVEHRPLRHVERMHQQRHRRHERGVGEVVQQRFGLGRAFDEQRVGLPVVERRCRLRAQPGPWWRMPK